MCKVSIIFMYLVSNYDSKLSIVMCMFIRLKNIVVNIEQWSSNFVSLKNPNEYKITSW